MTQTYPRIASLKTAAAFREHLHEADVALEFDETLAPAGRSPLGESIEVDGVTVGNRFCILPMEGWDGTRDGAPSDLTRRRWRHFGGSGANRTVRITPAKNQNGTAKITVVVSDGHLTAVANFLLTVNAVNDPPTISSIADRPATVGISTGPINCHVFPASSDSSK